ncbi:MAG: hypothetical protein LBH75_04305 [Treponema sp.]|nr:hypothetical protein [Treponema sp.]
MNRKIAKTPPENFTPVALSCKFVFAIVLLLHCGNKVLRIRTLPYTQLVFAAVPAANDCFTGTPSAMYAVSVRTAHPVAAAFKRGCSKTRGSRTPPVCLPLYLFVHVAWLDLFCKT